ncbi:MAG: bifunctional sulfate adenylyltransferase/adenylylsulfate kinase [Candidatus Bipolaricaulia bacterium]
MSSAELVAPHGGELTELIVDDARARELAAAIVALPDWDLTQRQVWDLELLLNGAFSPLRGFMTRADYASVCERMRLTDDTLWPVPIALDVPEAFAEGVSEGDRVALRHPEGMPLAVLTVEDIWRPDREAEAEAVYGTDREDHPGVFYLRHQTHPVYLGGPVEGVEHPPHHTFKSLRHTPSELRETFRKLGWRRVVGFQTRNPMHRAHVELTKRAAARAEANLLIHPAVGRTSPGDLDYFVRVRCYQRVLEQFPPQTTMLSLLPLAMRMAGPREALWHAIIRKNHGCSHFIVGRDHAGPKSRDGDGFYEPDAARELVDAHATELGVEPVTFTEIAYVQERAQFMERDEIPEDATILKLSGTELRRRLREGLDVPDWFSYPEVIQELRKVYPPRSRQGFTVFFTGLSGAGKSTIAQILMAKLMEDGGRPVTLLDGDLVRKHLSSELGFSKHDRDINIKRIGFVASEITKNRGVAICAPIAPYRATRQEVHEMIAQYGGFVLVHVATPLEVCEERDRKGLYAKARAGVITDFTGIDDPYETPENPDVTVDTGQLTAEEAAHQVLLHLESEGFINNQTSPVQ